MPGVRGVDIVLPRVSRLRHGWIGFSRSLAPGERGREFRMTNHACSVVAIQEGDTRATLVSRGREFKADGAAGDVRFYPADGEEHCLFGTAGPRGMRFATLFIPPSDMVAMAAADGIGWLPERETTVWPNDPLLARCVDLLVAPAPAGDDVAEEDKDEAARRLVLRLAELTGAAPPDWYADSSAFDRRTLRSMVALVDARLEAAPSTAELARFCGLSPSHFAKKFRHTTGWSLGRFVNRRRLRAALERLQAPRVDLATLAIDLGFSSQSHFTRLFSELTGMTPAAYRRQFRPLSR